MAPTHCALGECPVWAPREEALYWLDLAAPTLHRWNARDGHRASRVDLPAPLGGLVLLAAAGEAALLAGATVHRIDLSDGSTTPSVAGRLRAGTHYNDAKVDRSGVLWAASSDDAEEEPLGVLQRWDAPTDVDTGFVVGNGPAFSPDGKWVYVDDTAAGRVLRHPREGGPREMLAEFGDEGLPDGLTVDAEGCLWVALWGGARVVRLSPGGERLGDVPIPASNVTSVAFGGSDLRTLFITTARTGEDDAALAARPDSGGLFAVETVVPGLAERPWSG